MKWNNENQKIGKTTWNTTTTTSIPHKIPSLLPLPSKYQYHLQYQFAKPPKLPSPIDTLSIPKLHDISSIFCKQNTRGFAAHKRLTNVKLHQNVILMTLQTFLILNLDLRDLLPWLHYDHAEILNSLWVHCHFHNPFTFYCCVACCRCCFFFFFLFL